MHYPREWVDEESRLPNIIQKFTDKKTGESCNVGFTALKGDLPSDGVRGVFKEEKSMAALLQPGLHLTSYKGANIAGLPALMIIGEGRVSGTDVDLMSILYVAGFGNNIIVLNCGGAVTSKTTRSELTESSALYSLIADSIALESQ